jgi:hypothetical protein
MLQFFQPKFKLAAGVTVTNLAGVTEGFCLKPTNQGYSVIEINISADKLQKIYLGLSELVSTPAFAIVETPTKKIDEIEIRKNSSDSFHNDVYCSDNVFFDAYKSIFLTHSQFFIDDGEVSFGFASCTGHDEVFVGRYKLVHIYAEEPDKYIQYLKSQNYPRREPLRTVFDTFSPQSPGSTKTIKLNGKTVYDFVEILKQEGFHFVERRAAS